MSVIILVVALFTGFSRRATAASTHGSVGPIWPDAPLSGQSSFYYADYKVPHVPKSMFLPDHVPNCPETGRTVCSDFAKYPSEQVFDVIQTAKARRFNFSSVFMDESSNDMEPNLKPKSYPKPTGKAYIVYQTTLPVLPIRYVNQQNSRYTSHPLVGPTTTTSGTKTLGSRSEGTSRGRASAGHQIVFPTSSNYPSSTHTYQFQPPASGSLLAPPVPTESHFQAASVPQTPASSYGTHTPQPLHSAYLNQAGNAGSRNFLLSENSDHKQATSGYDPRSFLSKSSSDPYNLPPPPPPPPPPTSWRPMFPSSTSDSRGSKARGKSLYDVPDEFTTQEKEPSGRYKRQADEEEVESVCRTQMQFISPKVALNDKAEWKFIVNLAERDPRLKQVIKVDVCSNANEPCSNQISLPFGFVSRCKQKYIKKKLLSLDPDGQGTSSENFFVPSCCVCEIVRVNSSKRKK